MNKIITAVFVLILMFPISARSQYGSSGAAGTNIFIIIAQKQEEKKKSRWTLAEWLNTKRRIALMDQWLALNSSSNLFEFSIGGDTAKYDYRHTKDGSGVTTTQEVYRGQASFNISILGFKYLYEKSNEDYEAHNGEVSLRLFGRADQGTNLIGLYGLRDKRFLGGDRYKNQYYGGSATLYLTHFLGAEGSYKQYIKDDSRDGTSNDGRYISYGGFIELGFMRLFGNMFREDLFFYEDAGTKREVRSGPFLGAKFYL